MAILSPSGMTRRGLMAGSGRIRGGEWEHRSPVLTASCQQEAVVSVSIRWYIAAAAHRLSEISN